MTSQEDAEARVRRAHIADRANDGFALCGVALPAKRLGAALAGRAVFCETCEQRWQRRSR